MALVFVDVGMSLDGFIAGPNGRAGNPLGDGGTDDSDPNGPSAGACDAGSEVTHLTYRIAEPGR